MPKVSVIIPTYNRCEILRKTLQNVLAQTLQNLEVIIIDDGSEDGTREIFEAYPDSRVRYFFKENGGAASARNLGLSKVSGEYIAFLDSDDAWPENYLDVMTFHLERDPQYGAAYSPITVIHPDGRKTESYKKPEGKSGGITYDLFKRGFIWPSASLFRSAAWIDFFFDEALKTSEDSDAFLRLSMRWKYIFVGEVEAFHRISSDSLSWEVGPVCTRFLVLERFYYKLGGHEFVPANYARKRLSHACRKIAEDRRQQGERKASIALYRRAIKHWPADVRLYWGLLKSFFSRGTKDEKDQMIIPGSLGDPVGPNRFSQSKSGY